MSNKFCTTVRSSTTQVASGTQQTAPPKSNFIRLGVCAAIPNRPIQPRTKNTGTANKQVGPNKTAAHKKLCAVMLPETACIAYPKNRPRRKKTPGSVSPANGKSPKISAAAGQRNTAHSSRQSEVCVFASNACRRRPSRLFGTNFPARTHPMTAPTRNAPTRMNKTVSCPFFWPSGFGLTAML